MGTAPRPPRSGGPFRSGAGGAHGGATALIVFDASTLAGAAAGIGRAPFKAFQAARASDRIALSRAVDGDSVDVL